MKYLLLTISILAGMTMQSQDSMNCDLVYHWKVDSIPGSQVFDNPYNEIWGYAADGREYAIIGSTLGTHIIDITDPANGEEIHFIEGAVAGPMIIHRDYHDYNGYLYAVADEGLSTLQVIDLNGLPETVEVVYDDNALFTRSHNIFIDEEQGIMYSCGGSDKLNLFDIQNPVAPELILECDAAIADWNSTVGYVHDIYVKAGVAWCNAGGNGLYVVDFNDLENVQFLASLVDYPESGYNHSGYLHDSGLYYALADETHGMRIKILDVSDLSDIQVASFCGSGITELSIPHNLIYTGDYLHISHYYDGYYMFDLSDPSNPVLASFYDTSEITNTGSYEGAWGVYPFLPSGLVLVSDMQEGLFVFQNDVTIRVQEMPETQTTVYPNPANGGDQLHIDLENNKEAQIFLFNGNGQMVLNDKTTGGNLMLPASLESGVYSLLIKLSNGVINKKLIIR